MQVKSVLVLSVEEAREGLVQWYADTVINDRPNLVECIRDNTLNRFVPNLPAFSSEQIAELYGELNVGEKLAIEHKVSQVIVETQPGWDLRLVWDIENLDPKQRKYLAEVATLRQSSL